MNNNQAQPAGPEEPADRRPQAWWRVMLAALTGPQAIVGGIIPAAIFYIVQGLSNGVTGAVAAGAWILGVVAFGFLRQRRINAFAVMAAAIAAITVLTTVLTRDPNFYLAEGAIIAGLSGLIFLGSLPLPRPLIQIIVETTGIAHFSAALRAQPVYRRAWWIVTAVWGVEQLWQAAVLLAAQVSLSLETFLVLGSVLGQGATLGLMIFSFWFPGWYWRRHFRQQAPVKQMPINQPTMQ